MAATLLPYGSACLHRDEIGEYYAIDIGGTNFRSIHATLSDKKGEVVSCAFFFCKTLLELRNSTLSRSL